MFYKAKFGELVKKVNENFVSVKMDENDEIYKEFIIFLKGNGTVTEVDIMTPAHKSIIESENNKKQYLELQPTDWYFIREKETGEEVPKAVLDSRTAIRLKYINLNK